MTFGDAMKPPNPVRFSSCEIEGSFLSDIFISYARADRALAEQLANDLKSKGYQVWWDAELVGSDDFYEVILQALHNAKAAIVIWTKASAKSRFVRDEARFALHLEKLVATRDPSLDTLEIPFGFQGQHTEYVNNLDQILRAVEKLGVKPMAVTTTPAGASDWERLKSNGSIDELVAFLGASPPEPQRQAAVARIKKLSAGPEGATGSSAVVRSLTMSSWQAFLSGLTFRMPKFQLSRQGAWIATGAATAASICVTATISLFQTRDLYGHVKWDNQLRLGTWLFATLKDWKILTPAAGDFADALDRMQIEKFAEYIALGVGLLFLVVLIHISVRFASNGGVLAKIALLVPAIFLGTLFQPGVYNLLDIALPKGLVYSVAPYSDTSGEYIVLHRLSTVIGFGIPILLLIVSFLRGAPRNVQHQPTAG
ncbi:MAG: toll/interleukin-1 receptor domain-containing protein [Pseudorhodoplanes sp.]